MNEYELIGRLADLDTRLKKLEGIEPIQPPQPAPVPPLVEAVEQLFKDGFDYYGNQKTLTLRLALAAEKRRQEIDRELIDAVFAWKEIRSPEESEAMLLEAIRRHRRALEAFDKERGV